MTQPDPGHAQIVLDSWPTGNGDDTVAVADCEPPAYPDGEGPYGGALDNAEHEGR